MFNLILTSDNILFYLIDTIVQGSQSYSNLERNILKNISNICFNPERNVFT